jgi:hypothetical protein
MSAHPTGSDGSLFLERAESLSRGSAIDTSTKPLREWRTVGACQWEFGTPDATSLGRPVVTSLGRMRVRECYKGKEDSLSFCHQFSDLHGGLPSKRPRR